MRLRSSVDLLKLHIMHLLQLLARLGLHCLPEIFLGVLFLGRLGDRGGDIFFGLDHGRHALCAFRPVLAETVTHQLIMIIMLFRNHITDEKCCYLIQVPFSQREAAVTYTNQSV